MFDQISLCLGDNLTTSDDFLCKIDPLVDISTLSVAVLIFSGHFQIDTSWIFLYSFRDNDFYSYYSTYLWAIEAVY